MTLHTFSSLRFLPQESLAALILSSSPQPPPNIAIIDVRDADYVGGHIATSMHFPTPSLDFQMPTLLRKCADKDMVIFHCALSQQRGPSAALRYLRERDEKMAKEDGHRKAPRDEGSGAPAGATGIVKKQEVFVLDGGFVKWQEK